MARVALYARVSSRTQDQAETIETQRYYLEQWVTTNGHTVAGWYGDGDVRSAIPISARPEGGRLLRDAARGVFDLVAVYSISRWSRYTQVWLDGRQELEAHGVELVCMRDDLRDETPSDRLSLGVKLLVSEYDRDIIREQMRDGRYRRASEGGYVGGAVAYGYRVEQDGRRRIIAIDDEEAEVVRRVYRWIVDERLSYYEIARRLNNSGVASPAVSGEQRSAHIRSEAQAWHVGMISRIVRREAYCSGVRIIGAGTDRAIEVPIPAIIERDLWERAQAQVATNRKFSLRNKTTDYLLSGVIRCGACDMPMYGTNRRYVCRSKVIRGIFPGSEVAAEGLRRCPLGWIRHEDFDQRIWNAVYNRVVDHRETMRMVVQQSQNDTARRVSLIEERDRLSATLDHLDRSRRRAIQMGTDGLITTPEVRHQLDRIAGEQEQVLADRVRVEAELQATQDLSASLAETDRVLMEWADRTPRDPSWDERRVLVLAICRRVTLWPDNRAQITILFEDVSLSPRPRIHNLMQLQCWLTVGCKPREVL